MPQIEISAPTTEIVDVTPDMAGVWLAEHNTHNRNLRESRVSAYARDMLAGEWQFNGDPIRFAIDGTLLDGQHRLSAVIRANKTIPMLIVRGLPGTTQETMDLGAVRSMADALALRGEDSTRYLAAIARRAVRFDRGLITDGGGVPQPTHAEMHAYVAAHPDIRRAVEVASRSNGAVQAAPSVIGTAYHICAQLDVPSAELFYVSQLIEAVGLREGDPARALRRRLEREYTNGRPMHPDDVFRYSIVAWNHYRDGNQITKLQAPPGGWGLKNTPIPR